MLCSVLSVKYSVCSVQFAVFRVQCTVCRFGVVGNFACWIKFSQQRTQRVFHHLLVALAVADMVGMVLYGRYGGECGLKGTAGNFFWLCFFTFPSKSVVYCFDN